MKAHTIRGSHHHTPTVGLATNHHQLTLKLGVLHLLYRDKEGILKTFRKRLDFWAII